MASVDADLNPVSIRVTYEIDAAGARFWVDARRLLAAGGEYQFGTGGRLYGRHELVSSLGSDSAPDGQQRRDATVIGLDAEYMKNGRSFSEYRASGAAQGRGAEAAIGLRNRWNLAQGLRMDTTFERVEVFSGAHQNPSAAVTAALAYTRDPRWKGTARMEWRGGQTSDSGLATLGLGVKLSERWTLLGRNRYAYSRNKAPGGGDKTDEWLQAGMAACGAVPSELSCQVRVRPAPGASGAIIWTLNGRLPPGASGTLKFMAVVR
ncbi:hypothetical protein [Rugamonas sp.]|uniref:hypothetical protein n=1 Tax=Rugamonas sp. TaxID=1926287 RepID=UPI0025EB0BE0|nr:hypothetical protein [Rugamonas sp.]